MPANYCCDRYSSNFPFTQLSSILALQGLHIKACCGGNVIANLCDISGLRRLKLVLNFGPRQEMDVDQSLTKVGVA